MIDPGFFIGFFVAFIVALIVGAIYAKKRARQRTETLRSFAGHKGWHFDERHNSRMDSRFPLFDCLRQGENRYAYNVMSGSQDGRAVVAFDYHYETHSTDSKGRRTTHHHHFSAVVIEPGFKMDPLLIRPEHFGDKIGGFFGWDDIDFESAEFSRRFFVKSKNRKWAFEVINQANMEHLLRAPKLRYELEGPHAIAWKGSCFKPPQFQIALRVLEKLLDNIPRDVVASRRLRA